QALEVRDFRLVTRLDQRLVALHDQFRRAPAEHGLLAEQVGLGLLGERRLQHAAPRAADRVRVGERARLRAAGRVLGDREQAWDALPGLELPPHQVARALGRHQHDVVGLAGLYLAVVD